MGKLCWIMAILLANTAIFRFATTRRKEIFSRKIGELFHQPSVGIFPRQGPPRRPRAQRAPRCCCQAYDCSIPVTHTWQRRGRCNYSSWHTTPSLAGKRRGWQGSARRNIYRASTSGVDGYYFAPAEHTWTRNWNRRRFCVFRGP